MPERVRARCALALAFLLGCSGTQGEPDGSLRLDASFDAATDASDAREDASVDAGYDAGPNPYARDAGRRDAGYDAGPPPTGPFPIVLAHGFVGFEDFAGVDFVQYFFGVKDALALDGELEVFTPAVDPFNASAVRGAELLAHVERVLAETGAERVNLIGHSQGGLDARWVAHARPDLVASVTTISTPHRGSAVADLVLDLSPGDQGFRDLLDQLVRLLGRPLWDASGTETSVFAALRQLSSAGAAEFNREITDAPGVRYFSIAGRSDRHGGGAICDVDSMRPFIRGYENELDPIDPLLSLSEEILDGGLFAPDPNDGLVTVASAIWGEFLGCIPADHLDEIGQLLGDRPGLFNPWRHTDFYRALVFYLRLEGF